MKEFKVDLEIITPMFLHGADGIKAEIRAPSIKGMMRYWWRAAKAENDISKLKCEEADIFGSTEKRSKVSIKILRKLDQLLIKSDLGLNQSEFGLNYLFPPIFVGRTRDGRPKEFFDAGTKFSVILSAQDSDVKQLMQAIASLWFLVFFGGLGARSRRGGGNLIAKSVNGIKELNSSLEFVIDNIRSVSELESWIKINYNEALKIIEPSAGTNRYGNLHGARLKIVNIEKKSWKDSLDEIGKIYKEHRRDYDLDKRAAMGLPIKNLEVIGGKSQSDIRSASRLILKVLKIKDTYYSLIIYLKGPILPGNYKLQVGNKRNIGLPKDDIIEEFLDERLKDGQEVNL